MASRLEQQERGQQFRVLDPAYLPVKPSFPNRGLFALAGAVVGLMLGVGLSVAVDYLDPTFKNADEVATALPYPVLAVLPYLKPKDQRRLAAARPPADVSDARDLPVDDGMAGEARIARFGPRPDGPDDSVKTEAKAQ